MVLAYDVEVADKIAKTLPGIHPYFVVRVKAKLLLFSPNPNMLLATFRMILYVAPFLFKFSWVTRMSHVTWITPF